MDVLYLRRKPLREGPAVHLPRGDGRHDGFLFVHRRRDVFSVQHQERFHRGVADPFVAVNKCMLDASGKPMAAAFSSKLA